MAETTLLYFVEEAAMAEAIGRAATAPMRCVAIERHRFPDGELKLRLPELLPPNVVLLRALDHPNEKLVELLLVAQTARELGARHLSLVSPYLAYMRQDMAFQPGEVVSQRVIGKFLASLFDAVVTVDPHLHRVATLQEAVPVPRAVVLSAAPVLSDWVASQVINALLIGPDEESAQWVSQAAVRHGLDWAVCTKVRHGDRHVEIALPEVTLKGRAVVLLDDVASSGHTLAETARLLLARGAISVDVAVTHALFAQDAMDLVRQAGVRHIWSTDCIAHTTNVVSMASAIAATLHPTTIQP